MSKEEVMARHYQDKQKDGNIKHQLKYANTYLCKSGITIYSKLKLDSDTLSLVNKIVRSNLNNCDYFIDSPIYSDDYMKEHNKELANAETVSELVAYLDNLDGDIKVIKADNHVEKGLELGQWSSIDGIRLQTYFYI